MTLNKNNWFAMYYNWIFGNFPQDVCSFFWGCVIAIIMAPFLVIGRPLLKKINEEMTHTWGLQAFLGAIVWLILWLINLIGQTIMLSLGYEFKHIWGLVFGAFGMGLVTIISIGAFIYGLYGIGVLWNKLFSNVSIPETHVISNTSHFIGAIRGKFCSRITWKD